jgi:hypothetical protein
VLDGTDSDFLVKPFEKIEQFVSGEVEPSSHSMRRWFFLLMLCQIIGVLDDRKLCKAEAINCTPSS